MNYLNKQNLTFLVLTLCLLTLSGYYFFNQQNEKIYLIISIFLGLLIIPFLYSKIERTLYLIILLAPVSIGVLLPIVNTSLSIPSELLTGIVIIIFTVKILLGLKVNKSVLFHPLSLILYADLLWTLIVSLNSSDVGVSIKRFVLKFAFIFVYYVLFALFFNNRKKQSNIYIVYALGLIYPIVYAMNVHAKTGFVQASSFSICQPYFADHTIYGACIAFIIPFFIIMSRKDNRKGKYIYPILLVVLVSAEILSYSRASWISLIICLFFYLATKIKIKGWVMLTGIGLIAFVVTLNFQTIYGNLRETETKYDDNIGAHLTSVTNLQNDASNLERVNRWVCAYRMFQEHPIMGFGPGTYQFEYDKFQTPEFMTRISTHHGNRGNAHSEYLTYLSEYGIIGFIVFLILVIYSVGLGLKLIYSSVNKKQKALIYGSVLGLITFYSHGLFNTFSDYEKMSILFYGSLAILVNLDLKISKQQLETN